MTTDYSDHLVIGMDVGGTGLKAAVIDRQGRVFIKEQRPTQRERGPEAVVASILDFAYDLARSASSPSGAGSVAAAGVAVPCPAPSGRAFRLLFGGARGRPLRFRGAALRVRP